MTPPVPPTIDIEAQVQAQIDKLFSGSNWRARVTDTVRDSFKARERTRLLREQVEKLTADLAAITPKDGAVVLSKEDGVIWTAFKALGKQPAELTTMLTEHGTLTAADTLRKETESFADAATALGYKNVPALTRMLTRENLVLEFKDIRTKDENDKTKVVITRVPYVRPKANATADLEALEDYLEREVPEFIPVFAAEVADDEESDDAETAPASRQTRGIQIAAPRGARDVAPTARIDKRLAEEEATQRASATYGL